MFPIADCHTGRQSDYAGKLTRTKSGNTCQRWDAQSLHNFTYSDHEMPEGSVSLANNYCRDIRGKYVPWCHTKNDKSEECDVPYCPSKYCNKL